MPAGEGRHGGRVSLTAAPASDRCATRPGPSPSRPRRLPRPPGQHRRATPAEPRSDRCEGRSNHLRPSPLGCGQDDRRRGLGGRDPCGRAGHLDFRADSRPHCLHPFWSRLRSSLIDTGVGPLPIAPLPGTDPEWSAWISILAGRLTQHGRRCLVVLDDFPVGPSCQLGDQVTQLASQAEDCLHLIIISSASPAIDVDKLQADRACTRLDPELLAMSDREVAAALSATGVHHVHPEAVSAVRAHTFGWARGVMLAARMMSASIDEQQPNLDRQALVPPLADLDRALDALIERDVLATLPPATRELVIRTSVADQVPADLARAVLDEDQPSGTAVVDRNRGFVDQTADGSLRCHPLLRRAALRRPRSPAGPGG